MTKYVYKITSQRHWAEAERTGILPKSDLDQQDGYIHLSTKQQIAATLEKHFANQENLVLLTIPYDKIANALKFESARDGQKFPHLYNDLFVKVIAEKRDLHVDANGKHIVSEII
ncbi:MAG: DUF952 domain-containing protein [Pseudomonadota bacterium]